MYIHSMFCRLLFVYDLYLINIDVICVWIDICVLIPIGPLPSLIAATWHVPWTLSESQNRMMGKIIQETMILLVKKIITGKIITGKNMMGKIITGKKSKTWFPELRPIYMYDKVHPSCGQSPTLFLIVGPSVRHNQCVKNIRLQPWRLMCNLIISYTHTYLMII